VSYDQIFQNNRRWAESKRLQDPAYFSKLAGDQRPEYLYIGCSDSRVPANEIMGLEPGEVFVHRNIANVVSNSDLSAAAVIDFGVAHLKVKHIVVCRHYGCGGVKAAMEPRDLGILNPWLRNIRDVYRLHRDELNAIADEERRYRRLVEVSVIEQCVNVIKTAAVQEAYLASGAAMVHGCVFDLGTGLLKDLEFNFEEQLKSIQEIYNLTDAPWFPS
jgi:carbonic anhydrase